MVHPVTGPPRPRAEHACAPAGTADKPADGAHHSLLPLSATNCFSASTSTLLDSPLLSAYLVTAVAASSADRPLSVMSQAACTSPVRPPPPQQCTTTFSLASLAALRAESISAGAPACMAVYMHP
eukprot:GHUV01058757.1.p1 GENE.GHUV01058757.1~~GHUV01058757.1.p1  ORF type:complete len:125 (+),score=0.26 GHUV01058757.1:98-472(+)